MLGALSGKFYVACRMVVADAEKGLKLRKLVII